MEKRIINNECRLRRRRRIVFFRFSRGRLEFQMAAADAALYIVYYIKITAPAARKELEREIPGTGLEMDSLRYRRARLSLISLSLSRAVRSVCVRLQLSFPLLLFQQPRGASFPLSYMYIYL